MVSSQSERALPKSDIGLQASVLIAYLWVFPAISLPGMVAYLRTFFGLTLSSAGVSRMLIRIGTILEPVHQEILKRDGEYEECCGGCGFLPIPDRRTIGRTDYEVVRWLKRSWGRFSQVF